MKKVLVVDDSSLFRRSIARAIHSDTVSVEMAGDGNEALEKFKSCEPDLVLLDVTMPNCDGKECLTNILKYKPTAQVIMISGIESKGTVQECIEIGAKGYIPKGQLSIAKLNDSEGFMKLVRNILGEKETI